MTREDVLRELVVDLAAELKGTREKAERRVSGDEIIELIDRTIESSTSDWKDAAPYKRAAIRLGTDIRLAVRAHFGGEQ